MDAEEQEICDFLQSFRNQFVAGREICKRAGGKWRFRENPSWAIPALTRLVDRKILEMDAGGHFRLMPEKDKKKGKRWISPHLEKIPEQGGKELSDVISIDDEEEEEEEQEPEEGEERQSGA